MSRHQNHTGSMKSKQRDFCTWLQKGPPADFDKITTEVLKSLNKMGTGPNLMQTRERSIKINLTFINFLSYGDLRGRHKDRRHRTITGTTRPHNAHRQLRRSALVPVPFPVPVRLQDNTARCPIFQVLTPRDPWI